MKSGDINRPVVIASSIGENLDKTVFKLRSIAEAVLILAKPGKRIEDRFPEIGVVTCADESRWSEDDLTERVTEKVDEFTPSDVVIVYRDTVGSGDYRNVEELGLALSRTSGARLHGAGSNGIRELSNVGLRIKWFQRSAALVIRFGFWLMIMPLLRRYLQWAHRREMKRLPG